MRVTNILLLEQHLMPDYAHPAHPTNTHTHTNKKDAVCLMTSANPTSSPRNLFSNSYYDECASFPITQLPKNNTKIHSISLDSSHKPNSTVPVFNKSKKSITGLPEKVCRYSGLFLLKTNSTSTSKGRECQAVSSIIINVSSYFIKYAGLSTFD